MRAVKLMSLRVMIVRVRVSMGVTGCSNSVCRGNGCEVIVAVIRQIQEDD